MKPQLTGWLIPVGIPGGINSGFGDITDGSGIIRLGGEILVVDADLYRLWRRASSVPQFGALLEWATEEGIADAGDLVEALCDAGLLISESADLTSCVGNLAVCMVGELFGNVSNPTGGFVVAGRNGARLAIGVYLFEILLRSDGVMPISVLCEGLDEASAGLDIPSTLDGFCESLPMLVRSEVVRLDQGGSR